MNKETLAKAQAIDEQLHQLKTLRSEIKDNEVWTFSLGMLEQRRWTFPHRIKSDLKALVEKHINELEKRIGEIIMKTENMTFSEALEAMNQGYEVERKNPDWGLRKQNGRSLKIDEKGWIVSNSNKLLVGLPIEDINATDWKIYNEPKPEPQFEIGELVMMRMRGNTWNPKFYSHKADNKNSRYRAISDECLYEECAKFDKDIIFTNKPAK